jgi:hypothetical protein
MTEIKSRKGDVAKPGHMASGALYSNRIIPRTAEPATGGAAAGETTFIVYQEGGDTSEAVSAYLRSSGIVYRAMRLFEDWQYQPARISSSRIPVDILAIGKETALLVQVIHSRAPVLDAATLTEQYGKKIQYLREMGTSRQFRKILLAYSASCGWKYYDVLPGGLIPAWDLPEAPAS